MMVNKILAVCWQRYQSLCSLNRVPTFYRNIVLVHIIYM